jgi:D-alanine-D-alanine ligase
MRIALTYNLRLSSGEGEADFDTRETVEAIAAGLERLGHSVERIDVSGPVSRTVARLESSHADLVFNTAEGRRGRFREAFYPALFEEMGIPFTGSNAYKLARTRDKRTTGPMQFEGLSFDGVLAQIVESASARQSVDPTAVRPRPVVKAGPLKVGFAFNVSAGPVGRASWCSPRPSHISCTQTQASLMAASFSLIARARASSRSFSLE